MCVCVYMDDESSVDKVSFACRQVIDQTRRLDATRPVTFAMSGVSSPATDTVV